MSDLPPLPKGFVLDDGVQASAALPALPKGFTLDAPPSPAADLVQSMPRGGVTGALTPFSWAAQLGKPEIDAMSMIGAGQQTNVPAPSAEGMTQLVEQGVTGQMHKPETRLGRVGEAIGQGLGNPLSYVGPGTLGLKVGGSVLSSVGSEGAGQAFEGTKFEGPAKLVGGLAGGTAAVKALGPKQLTAAVPNSAELRVAKDTGYQAARDADLVLDHAGPASWAAQTEHELTNGGKYAFTGGPNGTAPKTLEALADARSAPAVGPGERATVTGANLDTLRIKLGVIAGETKDFKPTPDAKAAMVAKRRLAKYTEDIPQDHVLAGDAAAYGQQTKTANANNAAFRRVSDLEQKLTNATDATEGSIAAKIDNQIKSKVRNGYLTNDKKQRGLTQDEVDAIRGVNSGSRTENILRQAGRFAPEGPFNWAAHLAAGSAAGAASGGLTVPFHIAAALGSSIAKHTAQHLTKSKAANLVDMLAKRSPEYQARVLGLPDVSTLPNKAQLIRVLMNSASSL